MCNPISYSGWNIIIIQIELNASAIFVKLFFFYSTFLFFFIHSIIKVVNINFDTIIRWMLGSRIDNEICISTFNSWQFILVP